MTGPLLARNQFCPTNFCAISCTCAEEVFVNPSTRTPLTPKCEAVKDAAPSSTTPKKTSNKQKARRRFQSGARKRRGGAGDCTSESCKEEFLNISSSSWR